MIKVVLALQHGMLPRTLHAAQPTPAVDWKGANMALVLRELPWLPKSNHVRRAGVSAFGIGGTNAHVIVEEPPRPAIQDNTAVPLPTVLPFLVSGHTEAAMCQQAEKLQRHISSSKTGQDRLGDVAYSLATTRTHLRRRLVLMARDRVELLEKLASAATSPSVLAASNHLGQPQLAMLFTGQGSQELGMGLDLYKAYPLFRESLDEMAAHFTGLEQPLLDVMWADPSSPAAALLHRTDFAQPAIFALEVALWRLWQSWGVRPRAVLGHSVGELAAAHVSGILDLSSACRLVAARGRLMQALPGGGRMVSLEASAAAVTLAMESLDLDGKVDIAGRNTPAQTVVSGDAAAAESLAAHFAGQGRKTKTLDVSHAFHSYHMDGMLAAFQAVAETICFKAPEMAIVSSLTGKLAQAGQLERPEYWVQQARRAVCFGDGIQTLTDLEIGIFLELGPRPVLCSLGAACLGDDRPDHRCNDQMIGASCSSRKLQKRLFSRAHNPRE
ncbi:hypothetical protein HIM_10807 [Hirsutella minnesotensis 3608]|uniref:Malonyl-CoA:ACP transacylase (MAT) domain-containing protein n=1 Tax=Hirsutella minnesotensis 3608 TaxID=1043627 RepID=A0A0F7ZRL2_9HYPO|nr:hypothetical protein HIM_10807 [Hirsutella minnesotensis 3608]